MGSIKLKSLAPCPSCQGTSSICAPGSTGKLNIYCPACGMRGPRAITIEQARDFWNDLPRHADSILYLLHEINNQKKHVRLLTDGLMTQQELWARAEKSMIDMAGIVKLQNVLLEDSLGHLENVYMLPSCLDERAGEDIIERIKTIVIPTIKVIDEVGDISKKEDGHDGRQ